MTCVETLFRAFNNFSKKSNWNFFPLKFLIIFAALPAFGSGHASFELDEKLDLADIQKNLLPVLDNFYEESDVLGPAFLGDVVLAVQGQRAMKDGSHKDTDWVRKSRPSFLQNTQINQTYFKCAILFR